MENNDLKKIHFPHMDEETYTDRYNLSMNDRLSYWSARAEEFLDWDVLPKKVEQIIDRKISYRQLHAEVVRLANGFAARGLKEKDKICIYASMLPETIVSMLACARLGVQYEFVDLLRDSAEIEEQVAIIKPKMIVAADKGLREGKQYPLAKHAQSMAEQYDSIESLVVIRNQGETLEMEEGRDVWYHQFISQEYEQAEPASVEGSYGLFLSYHNALPPCI